MFGRTRKGDQMRKHLLALSVIISSFLLVTPRLAAFQDSSPAYKLQVHVNYTGAGTVDDKHKIYVSFGTRRNSQVAKAAACHSRYSLQHPKTER